MFQSFKRWHLLTFFCLVAPLFACQCTLADFYNALDLDSTVLDGELTPEQEFCVSALQLNGMSQYDALRVCTVSDNACLNSETTSDMTADEMIALCGPQPLPPTPQGVSNIAPPKPMSEPLDCSMFRLTSPTDGLPNGMATFYWDPLPQATRYMIDVFGEGAAPVSFATDAPNTFLEGDVGAGAIGGMFAFTIQATAFIGDEVACTHSINIFRESSGGGQPQSSDDDNDDGDDHEEHHEGGGNSGGGNIAGGGIVIN